MDIKPVNRISAEPEIDTSQTNVEKQNESAPSGISLTPDVLETNSKSALTMFDPGSQSAEPSNDDISFGEKVSAEKADDEVIVQFQSGDLRDPYQIGYLWNSETPPPSAPTEQNLEAVSLIKSELAKEQPDFSRISSALDGLKDLRSSLDEEIAKWEEKLNSVGDDAQLANVDLQNILQKQQQTLQMMSNISKMLFDTAQAVIRKLGG